MHKPAVSIKYGVMKFNMACIRLFEGIKYVLPILHPNKKRLALIMCPEEDSASVEWARQKGENWVNKDITSLEFVENIFRIMNWNRECRYKVLGRVANSDQGLCMLFDLEEAIMFTPKPQEYTDPLTGEMKKKQMKFFPDAYKNRIGKSYNDYIEEQHRLLLPLESILRVSGCTLVALDDGILVKRKGKERKLVVYPAMWKEPQQEDEIIKILSDLNNLVLKRISANEFL